MVLVSDTVLSAALRGRLRCLTAVLAGFALVTLVALMMASVAVVLSQRPRQLGDNVSLRPSPTNQQLEVINDGVASRIAFGSCLSYTFEPQPIWTDGVIPSTPDAWIWTGDFVYFDLPITDCAQFPNATECHCGGDWLHRAPYDCHAGDYDNALERLERQLRNDQYLSFLDYMCPNTASVSRSSYLSTSYASTLRQQPNLIATPPNGADPTVCPKPIIGVYDDHDFTWNNGNGRLPHKFIAKQLFLDSMGVPSDSIRRNMARGIEYRYRLNALTPDKAIDVIMLDERYDRETMPCYMRRDWCLTAVLPDPTHQWYSWCDDFLHGSNPDLTVAQGSCCWKDEKIAQGWCTRAENRNDPLWEIACDTTSPLFGSQQVLWHDGLQRVLPVNDPLASDPTVSTPISPFCEMLGKNQRQWLRAELAKSDRDAVPLKFLVSGSVLIGNPAGIPCPGNSALTCRCSMDDWGLHDCYEVAQRALLSELSRHSCVVVLTGDFHWSDIKVLLGGHHPYTDYFQSYGQPYPLYQVMASGMTPSITLPPYTCASFRRDPTGLRAHPECSFVSEPAFGMALVDWDKNRLDTRVSLQIRDRYGTVKLESNFSLSQCQIR